MEDYNTIEENVLKYLRTKEECRGETEEISISINPISKMTNYNYLINVFNKTTNELRGQLLYKRFGEISECVDRELETTIIHHLSNDGVSPKILYNDEGGQYRIEEYIPSTTHIKKGSQFKSDIIEQIIQICVSYSLISSIYSFTVQSNELLDHFSITINCDDDDFRRKKISTKINNNIFDMSFNHLYNKALENFNIFAEKFKSTIIRATNNSLWEDFEKFELFVNNFKFLFLSVFPKKGNMILNHNDLHRKNLIIEKDTSKIFVLDHEYAALNLIGIDITNFLNESIFDYSPNYICHIDKINLEHYFEIYLQYINKFEQANPELNETEKGRELLEEIKTKKYYLNLHGVINAFWVLYCVIYMNFEKFSEGKEFNYFRHGLDRIKYFEKILEELNLEEESQNDDEIVIII